MASYTQHMLRYRGRVAVATARNGGLYGARVIQGKPLDFSDASLQCGGTTRDAKRLHKLFLRNKAIRQEISEFRQSS